MNIGKMRRRIGEKNGPVYLMTAESNPEVFAICLSQGWCSAKGMTYEEAAAVKNISQVFRDSNIVHFEELKYFGVTSFGTNAIRSCPNLLSITFPDSLVSTGNYSLQDCRNLQTVNVGANILSFGSQTFYRCQLKSVTIHATTPPNINGTVGYFINSSQDYKIYVPAGSVDTYKSATGWSSFASKIQAIPE